MAICEGSLRDWPEGAMYCWKQSLRRSKAFEREREHRGERRSSGNGVRTPAGARCEEPEEEKTFGLGLATG
jgi:hypothetical protein